MLWRRERDRIDMPAHRLQATKSFTEQCFDQQIFIRSNSIFVTSVQHIFSPAHVTLKKNFLRSYSYFEFANPLINLMLYLLIWVICLNFMTSQFMFLLLLLLLSYKFLWKQRRCRSIESASKICRKTHKFPECLVVSAQVLTLKHKVKQRNKQRKQLFQLLQKTNNKQPFLAYMPLFNFVF